MLARWRKLGSHADAGAALRAMSRASKAIRVLQQKTVDAFITRYMETIENKTAQLRSFSRLISHEIRQPLGVLQVLSRVITVPEGDEETGDARAVARTQRGASGRGGGPSSNA